MTRQVVSGTFDVALTPQPHVADVGDPLIASMSLDKQFHGDLNAASKGQMLGVRTGVDKSSGGYVAMEHVVGTLTGRSGAFVLQHSSTMARDNPTQSVTVVPNSGSGQLEGLAGAMTIEITDGVHSYRLEYWFESAPRERPIGR